MLFCQGFKNNIAIFVFCIHRLQAFDTKWKKTQFECRIVVGHATMFAHWAQKVCEQFCPPQPICSMFRCRCCRPTNNVRALKKTRIIKAKKWLPWQRPLGAGYWQYLPSVGRPLKLPSITNCVVAIVDTKPVNSNFSPKIGCHGNVPQHLWTPSNT